VTSPQRYRKVLQGANGDVSVTVEQCVRVVTATLQKSACYRGNTVTSL